MADDKKTEAKGSIQGNGEVHRVDLWGHGTFYQDKDNPNGISVYTAYGNYEGNHHLDVYRPAGGTYSNQYYDPSHEFFSLNEMMQGKWFEEKWARCQSLCIDLVGVVFVHVMRGGSFVPMRQITDAGFGVWSVRRW